MTLADSIAQGFEDLAAARPDSDELADDAGDPGYDVDLAVERILEDRHFNDLGDW